MIHNVKMWKIFERNSQTHKRGGQLKSAGITSNMPGFMNTAPDTVTWKQTSSSFIFHAIYELLWIIMNVKYTTELSTLRFIDMLLRKLICAEL